MNSPSINQQYPPYPAKVRWSKQNSGTRSSLKDGPTRKLSLVLCATTKAPRHSNQNPCTTPYQHRALQIEWLVVCQLPDTVYIDDVCMSFCIHLLQLQPHFGNAPSRHRLGNCDDRTRNFGVLAWPPARCVNHPDTAIGW